MHARLSFHLCSQELSEWVVMPLLAVPAILPNSATLWPELAPNPRLQPLVNTAEHGMHALAGTFNGARFVKRMGHLIFTMDDKVRGMPVISRDYRVLLDHARALAVQH